MQCTILQLQLTLSLDSSIEKPFCLTTNWYGHWKIKIRHDVRVYCYISIKLYRLVEIGSALHWLLNKSFMDGYPGLQNTLAQTKLLQQQQSAADWLRELTRFNQSATAQLCVV